MSVKRSKAALFNHHVTLKFFTYIFSAFEVQLTRILFTQSPWAPINLNSARCHQSRT